MILGDWSRPGNKFYGGYERNRNHICYRKCLKLKSVRLGENSGEMQHNLLK